MNQQLRRRRTKYAELEAAITKEAAAKDSLLDLVNLLLTRMGGTVAIPAEEVQAATRHNVVINVKPPDPDVAGSVARYVISLEGFAPPEQQKGPSILERIGLWVPGR